jgi:hypothetical protein
VLPGHITILTLVFATLFSAHLPSKLLIQEKVNETIIGMTIPDLPPPSCRVTLPPDGLYVPPSAGPWYSETADQFYFGTDKLWTVLPADGIWRGSYAAGPGDFVYADKMPWYRVSTGMPEKLGPLTIRGKRLDGPAPTFIETNDDFQYNPGGMMGGISIPAYGCWQINGHYAEGDVTFTVWVTGYKGDGSATVAPTEQSRGIELPRIQVDGDTAARALVYKVLPELPPMEGSAKIRGAVVLQAVIGTDGRLHDVRYVSGPQALAQAATDAVHWYQYRLPIVNADRDEEIETTVTVKFPSRSE